jgi:hypothetical protein
MVTGLICDDLSNLLPKQERSQSGGIASGNDHFVHGEPFEPYAQIVARSGSGRCCAEGHNREDQR